MGIIKAVAGAIGGTFEAQWLETIEPEQIDNTILATNGVAVRHGDSRNRKRTEEIISNGSVIHVPENVYMLLIDGGKIVSATDEAGYYQVDNSKAPSIFFKEDSIRLNDYTNTFDNTIQRPGGLANTLRDSWERFKFGGTTPKKQKVVYINKQEIPDIRFGTKNPVPYTDRVLVPGRVVPCKLTSFGTYSIKIADPILFYSEVCSKTDKSSLAIRDMAEQYINEFLMAYTTALASLSSRYVLISDIPAKTAELGSYMAETLDKEWLLKRGFYIHSVGIAGISFDEKTEQLLDKYANDSILMDPNARAARMSGSIAAGMEAAGSNPGGSMIGFAGMGMGMNTAAALGINNTQQQPQQAETAGGWVCSCGAGMSKDANFCSKCGTKKPGDNKWKCTCGNISEDLFCSKCGKKRP